MAARMMPPFTTFWIYGDTFIRLRPLLSTPSIIAPTSVPTMAPRPPEIAAPPSTTAAMASSSYDIPMLDWPLLTRAASKLNENLYASTALEKGTGKIKTLQITHLPLQQANEEKAARAIAIS